MLQEQKGGRIGQEAHTEVAAAFFCVPHPFDADLIKVFVVSTKGVKVYHVGIRGRVEPVKLGEKSVFFQKGHEEGNIAITGGRKSAHQATGWGLTHLQTGLAQQGYHVKVHDCRTMIPGAVRERRPGTHLHWDTVGEPDAINGRAAHLGALGES